MKPYAPSRIVSAEEMRILDRVTAAEFAVPTIVLMENAGRAVAEEVRRRLRRGRRAVIVCGIGNNGGDGLVAARHLINAGAQVEVLLLGDQLKGDAALNLEAFRRLGGTVRLYEAERGVPAHVGDWVVDAIFGTGLARPADGLARSAIEAIRVARERGARVLAVDLPSGLSSDTGRALGVCVLADVTVTFAYVKRGLALEPGSSFAGELVTADISIPRVAEARLKGRPVFMLTEEGIRSILPKREADAHKGDFGHVLVVAGSPGRTGAAALTCAAALRGGAGLVTLAGRAVDVGAAQAHGPEAMGHLLPGAGPLATADLPALVEAAQGKTVIVAGPGMWRGPETGALLGQLLAAARLPAVLDADALNALAETPGALRGAAAPVVVTPHPGEMARLAGLTTAQVQEDRIGVARRYADERRVTVVLKGARTVIADVTGGTAVNPTGNPGMATAGAGDVLAGLCAALLAQGVTAGGAACAAAYVHGLAGDRVRQRRGSMGLVATDLLEGVTEVWASWGV